MREGLDTQPLVRIFNVLNKGRAQKIKIKVMNEVVLSNQVKKYIKKNEEFLLNVFKLGVLDNEEYFEGWGSDNGADFIADVIKDSTKQDMSELMEYFDIAEILDKAGFFDMFNTYMEENNIEEY